MAKILFLSVLLSVLLSFHVVLGDAGWVLTSNEMDHFYLLTHDHASIDLCKVLLKFHIGRLPGFLSVKISECALISIKAILKTNVALHMYICASIRVQVAQLIYADVELTARLILRLGRHGLYVHACAIVDAVIRARSLLFTDAISHGVLDGLARLLTGPFCDRGRVWCRDLNYCLNFSPKPFPIPSSCYGVWRNKPPRIDDHEIDLRSQPVCTCRDMEDGVSVNLEAMVALKIALSPKDQTYFFCHEKDISYIFECMRKGKTFNDILNLVSLNVGVVLDRLPKLVVLSPRTSHIVLKIECTRISVDMQPGHALLCIRLRINIGCDSSNFTSFLTFNVMGCLNLNFNVDCVRELLLLTVSLGSPLRIRSTCTEGDDCEGEQGALNELFLDTLSAWIVNHINVMLKVGIQLPSLIGYPCDRCQKVTYGRRRVYCPCTLKYDRK